MQAVRVETMRRAEARLISSGTSGYTLMRRAGERAADFLREWIRGRGVRRVVAVIGRGNNGGDALVTAAALGLPAKVCAVSPLSELHGEAAQAAADLPGSIPVRVCETLEPGEFRCGDLILDGLLGIGFSGRLRPQFEQFIRVMNGSGLPVVAMDLPSGLDGDSGEAISGVAVQAALTLTFGLPKRGLFHGDGPRCCGRLRLIDIGVPEEFRNNPGEESCYFWEDALRDLPRPEFDTHKMRRGRLLIAAGSREYSGAAVLAARAGLRGGAGIVRLATPGAPPASVPAALILQTVPSASDGGFGRTSLEALGPLLAVSDAVAAGSGWGRGAERGEVLSALLDFPGALLLDADALNAAAEEPERWNSRPGVVITPHPGEAERLAKGFGVEITPDRTAFARALAARLGAVTVLKGAFTVVAAPGGAWSVNTSGTPALATAGSGDVLTGLIGALLAIRPAEPFRMAQLGVFLHGVAGELGGAGLIADDLPELLPVLLRRLGGGGAAL